MQTSVLSQGCLARLNTHIPRLATVCASCLTSFPPNEEDIERVWSDSICTSDDVDHLNFVRCQLLSGGCGFTDGGTFPPLVDWPAASPLLRSHEEELQLLRLLSPSVSLSVTTLSLHNLWLRQMQWIELYMWKGQADSERPPATRLWYDSLYTFRRQTDICVCLLWEISSTVRFYVNNHSVESPASC